MNTADCGVGTEAVMIGRKSPEHLHMHRADTFKSDNRITLAFRIREVLSLDYRHIFDGGLFIYHCDSLGTIDGSLTPNGIHQILLVCIIGRSR